MSKQPPRSPSAKSTSASLNTMNDFEMKNKDSTLGGITTDVSRTCLTTTGSLSSRTSSSFAIKSSSSFMSSSPSYLLPAKRKWSPMEMAGSSSSSLMLANSLSDGNILAGRSADPCFIGRRSHQATSSLSLLSSPAHFTNSYSCSHLGRHQKIARRRSSLTITDTASTSSSSYFQNETWGAAAAATTCYNTSNNVLSDDVLDEPVSGVGKTHPISACVDDDNEDDHDASTVVCSNVQRTTNFSISGNNNSTLWFEQYERAVKQHRARVAEAQERMKREEEKRHREELARHERHRSLRLQTLKMIKQDSKGTDGSKDSSSTDKKENRSTGMTQKGNEEQNTFLLKISTSSDSSAMEDKSQSAAPKKNPIEDDLSCSDNGRKITRTMIDKDIDLKKTVSAETVPLLTSNGRQEKKQLSAAPGGTDVPSLKRTSIVTSSDEGSTSASSTASHFVADETPEANTVSSTGFVMKESGSFCIGGTNASETVLIETRKRKMQKSLFLQEDDDEEEDDGVLRDNSIRVFEEDKHMIIFVVAGSLIWASIVCAVFAFFTSNSSTSTI